MEHPTSPIRGALPQDSRSPHSPQSEHRHRGIGDRYRPPPPHGYHPPPGYSHYPPYGGPPQSPYGPPPPQGYSSRGPQAGYTGPPPHHSLPFGYGYPPGPRGSPYHYAGGYDGAYAVPTARQAVGYQPIVPSRQAPPSQPLMASQESSSPSKIGSSPSPKSSPTRTPRDVGVSCNAPKQPDHANVERLRAAAAAELTHEEVKPIQSDFHFFAQENMATFRALVEEEMRKSKMPDDKFDPFLFHSNLNTRLKTAWETMKSEEREIFMIKEEEDRRRFMEEDEIASRHCATLTARGKSPRSPEKVSRAEEGGEEKASISDETVDTQSGTEQVCRTYNLESPPKRSSPPPENDSNLESPTKRKRYSAERRG